MSHKLQNFTLFDIKKRRSIALPHQKIIAVFVLFVLVLSVLSLLKLLDISSLSSNIDGLKAQQKIANQKLASKKDKNAVGFLKPEYLKEQKGFYDYFHYLTTFKMQGVWLTKLTVEYKGADKPLITFLGEADRPESLQTVLSALADSRFYSNPMMRISSFSVLRSQSPKNTRRKRNQQTVDTLKKENFKELYQFKVTNDSVAKPASKNKKKKGGFFDF